jgi:hypothetical protein
MNLIKNKDNMEQEEKILTNLFQQMGDKSGKSEIPDIKLKDAVFSTVDATALVADIVDLFTFKFIQAQAEVMDNIPESEYGNEKHKLLKYFEKKYAQQSQNIKDTEG